MILEIIPVGAMEANCYILASDKGAKALIIDPGADAGKILSTLKQHNLSAGLVINTHGHYDHIGCDDKFGVPIYIHKADLAMLKDPKLNFSAFFSVPYKVKSEILTLEEGQVISLGGISLKVLHIPGHTPGGVALVLEGGKDKMVFTGDTLFYHGIGRSDLDGGDGDLLAKSIREKLLVLPPETIVYPGHGSASTIKDELNNPYLDNA